MARVLVAEDEPAVAHFITRALDTVGHQVVLVQDGGAAYGLITAEHFDLLLSDIRMPVMDGIALALAVSAEQPTLPILLMTGYTEEFERAGDLEGLVAGMLLKPFTLAELRAAVDRALRR